MAEPTTADPQSTPQEQLTQVRERLHAEGGRLAELIAADPSDTRDAEIASTRSIIMGLDARWTVLSRMIQPEPQQGQGPQAGTRQVEQPGRRTLGQEFIDSEAYRNWRAPAMSGERVDESRAARLQGACSAEVRTTITAVGDTGFTSGGAFVPIMPYALDPRAARRDRLYVRDLLPQNTTTFEVVHYISETYVTGSDADVVAEGAQKPEVAMNWARNDVRVKKIAAWIPATKESLADATMLRGAIDNRMQYKVAWREEYELLHGDGTGEHQLGLLNAPGLQTQAFDTDAFTSIADGIALIENHDLGVNGMVLNPSDYWATMAKSHTTLTGASPFQGPPNTVWGLNTVRTPRMAAGTALIGDFNHAEIFDREAVNIIVGDQHSDFFIKNLVAILAEERLLLAIYRGDAFATVALS